MKVRISIPKGQNMSGVKQTLVCPANNQVFIRLNAEQEQALTVLYQYGVSQVDAGKFFGVTPQAIGRRYKKLKRSGVDQDKKMSLPELLVKYDIDKKKVVKRCSNKRSFTLYQKAFLRLCYIYDIPQKQVAKLFSCSQSAIQYRFSQLKSQGVAQNSQMTIGEILLTEGVFVTEHNAE